MFCEGKREEKNKGNVNIHRHDGLEHFQISEKPHKYLTSWKIPQDDIEEEIKAYIHLNEIAKK